MKTVEITRAKTAASGVKPPSTWAVFADIYRKEGLAGVNKGVNAVAVRQCTNWGSRFVAFSWCTEFERVMLRAIVWALHVSPKIPFARFGVKVKLTNSPLWIKFFLPPLVVPLLHGTNLLKSSVLRYFVIFETMWLF